MAKFKYYWQLLLSTIYPKGLNYYPVVDDNMTIAHPLSTYKDIENVNNLQALLDVNQFKHYKNYIVQSFKWLCPVRF